MEEAQSKEEAEGRNTDGTGRPWLKFLGYIITEK